MNRYFGLTAAASMLLLGACSHALPDRVPERFGEITGNVYAFPRGEIDCAGGTNVSSLLVYRYTDGALLANDPSAGYGTCQTVLNAIPGAIGGAAGAIGGAALLRPSISTFSQTIGGASASATGGSASASAAASAAAAARAQGGQGGMGGNALLNNNNINNINNANTNNNNNANNVCITCN